MKRFLLSFAVLATLVLFAGSAVANVLSNPNFSTGGPPTTLTGAPVPGGSAAPPWTTWNNSPATTKTEHLATYMGRSGVIHVITTGASNGLVQVWAPINTGPSKVVHSASIFVKRGKVGIGTGNGGNTGVSAITRSTGRWETIRGTNSVCPANETIIYSTDGPAEFYVDSASVEVVSQDPCPQGKPNLIIEKFGFKGPSAPEPGNCTPGHAVYIFTVTVKNIGTAASPSSASLGNKALVQVMAQDKAGWGNGAFLNALAPGASQTVDISVYYLMSDPAFMWTPPNVVHPFLAIADPLGLVNESNELDNKKGPIKMSKPLGCPPPRLPPAAPILK